MFYELKTSFIFILFYVWFIRRWRTHGCHLSHCHNQKMKGNVIVKQQDDPEEDTIQLRAHKCILSARSEYFKALFSKISKYQYQIILSWSNWKCHSSGFILCHIHHTKKLEFLFLAVISTLFFSRFAWHEILEVSTGW